MLIGDSHGRLAAERLPSGEQLVQHDPGGVQIGARVDGLALRLLGREVGGGPDDLRRLGDRRRGVGHGSGDAEVHDLDLALFGDHDVTRLDVAVHDACTVRVVECLEDAVDVAHGVFDRHGSLGDDVLQQRAADELHHDVGRLVTGGTAGG